MYVWARVSSGSNRQRSERFDAEPTALPEFERAIKLDDGVMRFLVVVNEGAQPVPVTAGKAEGEEDDE